MTEPIALPLWLLLAGGLLAAWALLDRLLLPSVRWYFRRRVNIVITEINQRLDLKLPDFKLTQRKVLIDRLVYDPKVLAAVDEYCREHDVPREVALEKVERYAKEIVPAFNALIYFRVGSWLSKTIARLLYRVRLGYADEAQLAKVDPNASVVFVMNHRSHMDYILVSYLAVNRVALSYAVGEWARVWPFQQLIQATGAYFVRRGSGDPFYRRVLARYVQMSTEAGVVQAIFPEGGLSRDGAMREPKLGLLKYMLEDFDPQGQRDMVFIPVGLNFDRVLEDRTLLRKLDPDPEKLPRMFGIRTALKFIAHNIWLMLQGKWYRFGYAAANLGTPISMREYIMAQAPDFMEDDPERRIQRIRQLARDLMAAVGQVIPVLPVALIAHVFTEQPEKTFSNLELKARAQQLIDQLEAVGAHVYIPRSDRDYAISVGLRMLTLRHLVLEDGNLYRAAADELLLLRYYANTISHFVPLAAAPAEEPATARARSATEREQPSREQAS
ncbi:MAG: 1-acyl-sn-glycerol-3-phosphate acyltransferase [Candidatus Marinimicrobia bacterium]|nr:1-acyl-sn-glycerol-3-phosphate acyltransferase [Candidatus Neomarinimicrobiota bacterium]